MTDWKLGQYVRVWRNEGYEYGFIESIEIEGENFIATTWNVPENAEVMLVGDDGIEIYAQVKDLEEGE